LISLELGGHPNDPRNLWPEFPHSPNAKDKVGDELHKKINLVLLVGILYCAIAVQTRGFGTCLWRILI
jgi:hypothetical protein